VKGYPRNVMEEFATLRRVLEGRLSLTRFGDGEFKLATGRTCVCQEADAGLAARLAEVARTPARRLMTAIPRLHERGDLLAASPRLHHFWMKVRDDRCFQGLLSEEMGYGSSFVTRGDNAPHILCGEFAGLCRELFRGARVLAVTGQWKSANVDVTGLAERVERVKAPVRDAWVDYEGLLARCMAAPKGTTFYLSCGPAATVLAFDLAVAGRRALDLGALHRFWGRMGTEPAAGAAAGTEPGAAAATEPAGGEPNAAAGAAAATEPGAAAGTEPGGGL
jgi:hypothetical protein